MSYYLIVIKEDLCRQLLALAGGFIFVCFCSNLNGLS